VGKIPEVAKRHICEYCGASCIPMADGDSFPYKGEVISVVICRSCDAKYGTAAYEAAAEKKRK